MTHAHSIILHHYAASPFAEKVRLALRIKNLGWSSVDAPVIMPKPDLTALTGGYRRVPVMQIGADIYCDTRMILDEIDRRYPLHPLNLSGHEGLSQMVSAWTDRVWFPVSVAVIFAAIGDKVPEAFLRDREAMTGRPMDVQAMQATAPMMREQWIAHAGWLNNRLEAAKIAGAGGFLMGSRPGFADVHAAYNVWWVNATVPDFAADVFEAMPLVHSWFQRLQEFEGQQPQTLSSEDAIAVAHDVAPRLVSASVGFEPRGIRPGDRVAIAPDDYARDWIEGDLVHADTRRVVIKRFDARAETINVHFPRAGYLIRTL